MTCTPTNRTRSVRSPSPPTENTLRSCRSLSGWDIVGNCSPRSRARDRSERIVAERAGSIAGSVLLFPPATDAYGAATASGDYPEVRLLAVAPEARGHGIGAALMKECARRARGAGAAALGLHTTDIMRAAVRMYERLGYVRTPEHDFVPAPGILIKGYRLDL